MGSRPVRPGHGGILNYEGSLNQLSQLYSSVFGRCCARPQFEQKCIYCSRKIKDFDYPALLPHEAKIVPDLCPYHFTVDEPNRIYFRQAQDPHQICRFCTASFWVYFHLCRFTRRSPFRIYTVEDMCISSMRKAGRSYTLERIYPLIYSNEYIAIDEPDAQN